MALIAGLSSQGQIIATLQLPPSGVIQKSQLWNILVTNPTQNTLNASINMMMTNNQTGENILGASAGPITIPPGNTMLNAPQLMPIQYNMISSSYNIDPGQNGFLPPGSFTICYNFILSANIHAVGTQVCSAINVEPLSPPQLIIPEDQTAIENTNLPQFSWLPPTPMNIFTNLQYDLYLVQIDSGQTASDALQTNIPILYQQDISGTSLLYPASAPGLLLDVQYAWKVVAKNNETPVSSSESWVFSLKSPLADNKRLSELPYTRLKKDGESGYSVCNGKLKFAYINETADTSWNLMIYDISSLNRVPVKLYMDSIPLKRGLNLEQIDVTRNRYFVNQHIYLLELHNSRNEVWRMKFEFLKPGN